jgi:hypothetical protein
VSEGLLSAASGVDGREGLGKGRAGVGEFGEPLRAVSSTVSTFFLAVWRGVLRWVVCGGDQSLAKIEGTRVFHRLHSRLRDGAFDVDYV